MTGPTNPTMSAPRSGSVHPIPRKHQLMYLDLVVSPSDSILLPVCPAGPDLGLCLHRTCHRTTKTSPGQHRISFLCFAMLPHAACLRVLLRLDRPRGTSWSFRTAAFGGLSSRTGAPSGLSFRTASTKKTVHEITNDRVCSVTVFFGFGACDSAIFWLPQRHLSWHSYRHRPGEGKRLSRLPWTVVWKSPSGTTASRRHYALCKLPPDLTANLPSQAAFGRSLSGWPFLASCPSSICAISSCPGLSAIASCHGLGPIELCLYSCLYRLYYML